MDECITKFKSVEAITNEKEMCAAIWGTNVPPEMSQRRAMVNGYWQCKELESFEQWIELTITKAIEMKMNDFNALHNRYSQKVFAKIYELTPAD